MRGGKRKGAGRKPSPNKLIRKDVRLRPDQIDYLNSLIRRTSSAWIRGAIDEKIILDRRAKWTQ